MQDSIVESEESAGIDEAVTGTFNNVVDAERALEALRAAGVPADRVSMVMGRGKSSPEIEPAATEAAGTNVGGGAATGATLGGIVGIVWGWISGSAVATVPGAVATVSVGILSSTITGLAIGAAVGGLVGALIGVGMPAVDAPEDADDASERRILVTVQTSEGDAAHARDTLMAHGATNVRSPYESTNEEEDSAIISPEPSPLVSSSLSLTEETSNMADELMGRDPNAVTGTKDAIDPETGALGTAGTPMTTGYGVSGSTIGTGSARGQSEQEEGDFTGAMPDRDAYDKGGRASADAPDRGLAHDVPVEEKHTPPPARADEAPVQSEPETRDIYEQGPSYETPTASVSADTATTDNYSSSDVDKPPTYRTIETAGTNESAGTDIPGTSDMRGLGDNTDD